MPSSPGAEELRRQITHLWLWPKRGYPTRTCYSAIVEVRGIRLKLINETGCVLVGSARSVRKLFLGGCCPDFVQVRIAIGDDRPDPGEDEQADDDGADRCEAIVQPVDATPECTF